MSDKELVQYVQQQKEKNQIVEETRSVVEAIFNAIVLNENKKEIINILFQDEIIASNLYLGSTIVLNFIDGSSYRINSGTKLQSIFRQISKKSKRNDEEFSKFAIWQSQIRNQRIIDGELCLSIHPLDYLTMSDNASGWSSCMNWISLEKGEYRAGTLECLNSSKIIVAYLKNSKHNFEFSPGYFWNNKLWRELFIIDNSIISEIKGYPYQNQNLTDTILNWLKELLEIDYPEELNLAIGIKKDKDKQINIIPENRFFMYNDFGTLPQHKSFINYSNLIDNYLKQNNDYYGSEIENPEENSEYYFIHLPFSERATCANCGKYLPELEEFDSRVLCSDCESGFKCTYCDQWSEGTEYYVSEEDPICEDCYRDHTFTDELSGQIYMENMAIKLYWEDKENNISSDFILIKDPWYYDEEDEYWQVFNSQPKLYFNNIYYITLEQIKDLARFKKLFHLE